MITLKNTNYDIITVGAGAAGLAAAISAKRNNRDLKIAILEAQSKAGKKILRAVHLQTAFFCHKVNLIILYTNNLL